MYSLLLAKRYYMIQNGNGNRADFMTEADK